MSVEKLAAYANILALIPGAYGTYGTWVLLHPAAQATTNDATGGTPPVVNLTAVLVSVGVAVGLIVTAAVINAVVAFRKQPSPQSTVQDASKALVASPAKFDATAFFRHSYYSPLQSEIENNVRAAATQNQPNDREGFYVKLLAVGLIAFTYDMIWSSIYKSQLLSLLELNRRNGFLPLAEIKAYYDQAAAAHPTAYVRYSFDDWLSFMKNQLLILKHPSDMVEITLRGKDFLKYLLHWGREADQRSL